MLRTIIALTLFSISLPASTLEERIHRIIRMTETTPHTGTAVAVIKDGKVILAKGFGYRDREKKIVIGTDTMFGIGSTTKAFAATTMKMIEEEKLIGLDVPIREYLPEFQMADAGVAAQVTTRDLLTHQTGLPRHDLLWYLTPFSRESLFLRLAHLPLNPLPEMGFRKALQYNNLMYMAAGYLLEKRTGKVWEDFVKERIFTPLQMTRTMTSLGDFEKDPNNAHPYLGEKALPYIGLEDIGPAGSINASVDDMAKWVMHLMSAEQTLVSKDGLKDLFSPQIKTDLMGLKAHYGLGWFLNRLHGEKLIWHGGNVIGYSTFVSFMPEKKLGLVILTNQSAEMSLYFEMPSAIYDVLLEGEASNTGASPLEPLPDHWNPFPKGTDAPPWETDKTDYGAVYFDRGYGQLSVVQGGARWYLSYYSHNLEMKPKSEDVFVVDLPAWGMTLPYEVTFHRKDGKITHLSIPLEAAVGTTKFRRITEQN